MKKHLKIHVFGKVQGVFFRKTANEVACSLGLKGWVRNDPDGSVSGRIEGEEKNLKTFTEWCHKGPKFAVVKGVEVEEGEWEGFEIFETRRS